MEKNSPLLEQNLERLILSFKAIEAGLWEYDIDADTIQCDLKWYSMLGIDPQTNPVTSTADFRNYIFKDDAEMATNVDLSAVDRLLADDERYHIEFRIVRPDGEMRWVRSVACLIEDQTTGTRKAIGCITFIENSDAADVVRTGLAASGCDLTEETSPGLPLTEKERACLVWVSAGKTAWETAKIIGRSQRTVEFHLNNAVLKLNAVNKIHAVAIAIKQRLI